MWKSIELMCKLDTNKKLQQEASYYNMMTYF